VPAKREITVFDLLTKTSGLAYGSNTGDLYLRSGFHQWYFADKNQPICDIVAEMTKLPFDDHPGERWFGGSPGTDVLGCVIEKTSGLPLDEYLRTRIWGPLKMNDTYFYLPKDKVSRFATVYAGQRDGTITRAEGPWIQGQGDYVDGPRRAFSGGAGMLSTAVDYARFLQMLLNGGELEGVRLLSPKTVAMMSSHKIGHLRPVGYGDDARVSPGPSIGFGFGVEVTLDGGRLDVLSSPGDYGWAGAYFPRWWIDPHEDMFALFMAQLIPSTSASDLPTKYRNLVYQALERPTDAPGTSTKPVQTQTSR
jgi:CubicO group peptidase (beta-lactamase class C family)